MSPDNTIRLLQRLLIASSASTQAYRRAAGSIDMTGFSTLFIEYAKDHARIASWVSRQIARVCRERHLETPAPVTTTASQELSFLMTNDLYALLNICIRLQDAVVTAFGEAKDSALAAPLRRFIAREYEQLKWAREGLDRLRRERTAQASGTRNAMEQLRLLQSGAFEPDRFAGLRPATN